MDKVMYSPSPSFREQLPQRISCIWVYLRKYASLRLTCTGGAALALLAAVFCWHGGVISASITDCVAAFFFQTGTVVRPAAVKHPPAVGKSHINPLPGAPIQATRQHAMHDC
jgi:hypothetical protein